MMLLLLYACGAAPTPCDSLCDTLVRQCGYEAFPDLDSCLQGCGYDEAQGARIPETLSCVEKASCDTFAILDCANRFGVQSR